MRSTLGGLDEEGVAALTDAERIALADGDAELAARARAELGYVDYLGDEPDHCFVEAADG